jgi:hypothetical protein
MSILRRRWLRSAAIASAVVGGIAAETARRRDALEPTAAFTGWWLLGTLAFLMLFQLRKKIAAPPAGSASLWMRGHLLAGFAALPLLLLHAPWRLPNGALEIAVAALFAAAWCSGVLGFYWTRTLPRRLSSVGEEVLLEHVPRLRGQIRDRASAAILEGVRLSGDATLGEFYRQRLQPYFDSAPRRTDRLFPSPRLRKTLLAELTHVARYLSDQERSAAEQLFALVRQRDAVDYHEALQWRLRAWLVVHLALTWPLLMAAGLHAWLAYVFAGDGAAGGSLP